ncbi:MAG: phosphomannomutase/phosphoglucomutase [Thermomicrobiales bacterium]|nr:phosphomannomutase/phosphoglucomutase [Thermomicrobiales bacterium]
MTVTPNQKPETYALFKAYDIRGVAPSELDPDVAYSVGRALVAYLQPSEVAVGRDMRVSGDVLAAALIDGIRDQGADVVDVGLVSTDALYFAVGKFGYAAGVMITASHNPPQYNGFKICREEARALSLEDGIGQIRDLVVTGKISDPPGGRRGDVIRKEIIQDYVDQAVSLVDVSAFKPFKVVVDAGNGMAGKTIPPLFDKLPCDLVPLFFDLDGTFPNHLANPIDPKNMVDLQAAVIEHKADLGVAFDGDADRMFLVDEQGKLIGGDITTAMVAISILESDPGAAICYNLICSRSVPETIAAHGGRPVRTPVGHSLIKKIMREEDAVFGGEHSGHYYFRDNWYADSGLFAMLRVLQLMSSAGKPLSEVAGPIDTRIRSGEINLEIEDKPAAIDRVKRYYEDAGAEIDEFDGLTVQQSDRWLNIRASNTEPLLRVNVEGDTNEAMESLRDEVLSIIAPARG